MKKHVVIIGGGQASVQLITSLRQRGFDDDITLVTQEDGLPYHRPPLSKTYLSGDMDDSKLLMRSHDFYTQNRIKLLLGMEVISINPRDNNLVLADKSIVSYTELVITTGASAFVPPLPGNDVEGVHVLRDIKQAISLKKALKNASKIGIIGGGFIGLEVASSARKMEKDVIVIEAQQRVMARAVSTGVSDFFHNKHQENAVNFHLSCVVERLHADSNKHVVAVELKNGVKIDTDLVLLGVGARPNIQLAQQCGIEVNNGIVVDKYCCTSVPNIYAAGDCVSQINAYTGVLMRLESIQNATDQAKNIASAIMGEVKDYKSLPWFWSDQMQHRLQIAGIVANFQDIDHSVYRKKKDNENFSIFHYIQSKLVVVESVNNASDHMFARKILEKGMSIDPHIVSDNSYDLKRYLKDI